MVTILKPEDVREAKLEAMLNVFRQALLMIVDGIERYLGYTDADRTAEIRKKAR